MLCGGAYVGYRKSGDRSALAPRGSPGAGGYACARGGGAEAATAAALGACACASGGGALGGGGGWAWAATSAAAALARDGGFVGPPGPVMARWMAARVADELERREPGERWMR